MLFLEQTHMWYAADLAFLMRRIAARKQRLLSNRGLRRVVSWVHTAPSDRGS